MGTALGSRVSAARVLTAALGLLLAAGGHVSACPDAPQAPPGRVTNDVIAATDAAGRAVLPDAERTAARGADAEPGITFTFDSDPPWSSYDLAALQQYVADFYPVIERIYGPPAYRITVNIRLDPGLNGGGQYDLTRNEITLSYPDPITVCHEMVHAFLDDAVLRLPAFEEGMATAMEIAVFNELDGYTHWAENHDEPREYFYELLNRPAISAASRSDFLQRPGVTKLRYHLAGYAWFKAYLEDSTFFREFNRLYLDAFATDRLLKYDEGGLVALAARACPRVEGLDFTTWYRRQYVFNTLPGGTTDVAEYDIDAAGFIFWSSWQLATRSACGGETMLAGRNVSWSITDWAGSVLDADVTTTGAYGEFDVGRFSPTSYEGRISVLVAAEGPDGPVLRSVMLAAARPGFFGVVSDADTGLVTVEYLNDGRSWTAPVRHGAFQVAEAESLAGRFRITLDYPDGRRLARDITKDRARYFVAFGGGAPGAQAWIAPPTSRMTAVPSLTTCRTRLFWERPTGVAGRLRVLDVQGRRVRTLHVIAGATSAEWDGDDDRGWLAEPGVYYLRLEAGATVMNAKVVLLR